MRLVLHKWTSRDLLWLCLLLICLTLQGLDLDEALSFNRQLIAEGHLWLLLTSQLVHLNNSHLWMNLGGLMVVALFFSGYCSTRQWLLGLFLCALAVTAGLYWLNPELQSYVGMSGVLHGLFMIGAWHEFRHYRLSGGILLVLIVLKLTWEQLYGALPGSESMAGGHVVVEAHLYGAIAGGLYSLLHQVIHIDNGQQDGQHDQQHDTAHGDNQ